MTNWQSFLDVAGNPPRLGRLAWRNVQLWVTLLIIGCAVAFMLWQGVGFAVIVFTVFAIWAILAVSLNLVVGFTGLLSVGHVGFFGIGAYTMAVLTSDAPYEQLRTGVIPTFGWSFFAALPVCIVLAGVAAVLVGVVFNRFRDDLFVLVSFGFAIIAYSVFLNLRSVTRGAFGIHEIARPRIGNWVFDGDVEFLLLCFAFLALVMLLSWFITTSSFGRVLTAIREDEPAIEVFGYRATHYKLAVWGYLGDDGRACRRSVRQLVDVRRPQFLHSAGVGAAGVHRDPGRSGDHLGIPVGRDDLRAAGSRNEFRPVPAHRVHRPGAPGGTGASCWCC